MAKMGMRVWNLAALAAALTVAGCTNWWPWSRGPTEQARYPADARIYQCDAGRQLVVRYLDGAKSVMVMYPEREFRLDQVPAASGARYSNARTTLHSSGDEAFVEEDGKTVFANCKIAPK
jgi:membrane-bound inhibitor of C-type lysozyme